MVSGSSFVYERCTKNTTEMNNEGFAISIAKLWHNSSVRRFRRFTTDQFFNSCHVHFCDLTNVHISENEMVRIPAFYSREALQVVLVRLESSSNLPMDTT